MAAAPDCGYIDFPLGSAFVFMKTLLRTACDLSSIEGRPSIFPSRAALSGRGYWISIPLTRELSLTVVNWITYWPLELAFTVNCWMIALFLAPATAKISKLVSTCVPLMVTLKMREPAADQKVSAKCRRTVWLDPAAAPGMV